MGKRIFIFIAGSFLLTPCLLVFAESPFAVIIALAYGLFIWNSPKLSTKIRKFWRNYWRIIIRLTKSYEVR